MKYLTTLSALFFFTNYIHYAVLLDYYSMEVSDYAHYAVLLSPLLKSNICTLITLSFFTTVKMKYQTTLTTLFLLSLLLRWILWLRPLQCFTLTTIKMKSLTTFSTLFYFTTNNPKYRTTLTTLLLSLIHQIVFPRKFQCFHIFCMCDSNFTVRKFSGVLHALLPRKLIMKVLFNDFID